MRDTRPPSAHAANIQPALPVMPATREGDLKMPAPMTMPTMIATASWRLTTERGSPRRRPGFTVRPTCSRGLTEFLHQLLQRIVPRTELLEGHIDQRRLDGLRHRVHVQTVLVDEKQAGRHFAPL